MELGLTEFLDMTAIMSKETTRNDPLLWAILQPYGARFITIHETLYKLMLDVATICHEFHPDDVDAFRDRIRRLRQSPEYKDAYISGLEIYRKLQQLTRHRLTHDYELGKSPVYFLPNEVLSHCFSFLAPPSLSDGAIEPIKPFHAVLPVCKHWYDIAVNTPELWTTVTTRDDPRRIQHSVERSGVLSLSAYIDVDSHYEAGNDREQALALVVAALHRIHDLNVNFDSVSILDILNGAPGPQASIQAILNGLSGAAPMLEHFSIKGPVHLDNTLFAGQTPPGLRTVSLYHCTGSPSSIFSTSLTSLTVELSEVWDSLDDMLSTLASMPSLVDFCWDTEGYSDADLEHFLTSVTCPEKSVALPKLESLELEAQLECVGVLMRYLVLAPQTSITVHGGFLHVPSAWDTRFTNMLDLLDAGFTTQYFTTFGEGEGGFDRLTISDFKDDDYVGFSALAGGCDYDKRPVSLQYGANFTLSDTNEYLTILRRMLKWPGLGSNIIYLSVYKRRLLDESWQWSEVLLSLPRLEEVELDGPAGRAFIATVSDSDVPSAGPDIEPVFKPVLYCCFLRKLVLRETKLSGSAIRRFQQYLTSRAESGWPCVSLSVVRCTIAQEVVDALKCSSGAIITFWDGEERWWDEHKLEHWLMRENHDTDEEDNFHSDDSDYLGEGDDDEEMGSDDMEVL